MLLTVYLIYSYCDGADSRHCHRRWVYAIAGRREDALRVIKDFKSVSARTYVDPSWIAAIYSGLQDKNRAFELLEKSY